MNGRMIARILSRVLYISAALLVLPLIAGLVYGESVLNFAVTIAVTAAAGFVLSLFKPRSAMLTARDGYAAVGLAWVLMGLFGPL